MPLLDYLRHRRDCKSKQAERTQAISNLPKEYHRRISVSDKTILDTPISLTVSLVHSGSLKPINILRAFGKRTLAAQTHTNCITEILFPAAEAWLATPGEINLRGPLAGIPVSLKDTINVTGYDSCIGYSRWVGNPATEDAPMVRLLKDAGAVPFVKTNVPITLLSFESTNDVFGRSDNPHVPGFSPGGSTGGEGALLAFGGSRVGIGTDVAGSVRVPAAWSGCYTVRCSAGRFPKWGNVTSMAGQEGVPAVYSPMAKDLGDLKYFFKAIIDMRPWEYEHTVHPIPWREAPDREMRHRPIRWGVLRDDGIVTPTPAIRRALETTVSALRHRGDEIVDITEICPSCVPALGLANRLLNSDGGITFLSHLRSRFEGIDAGVQQLLRLFQLPGIFRSIYSFWHRYIRRDPIYADLVYYTQESRMADQWKLVVEREQYRAAWFNFAKSQGLDFILSPVNATPAVPAGGMKDTVAACGYTFLWNLVDWSAGVVPIGKVDARLDAVEEVPNRNRIERKAWRLYDAAKMEGLPTAVQIVGGRLEEERVIWGMERVVKALRKKGVVYEGIEVQLA